MRSRSMSPVLSIAVLLMAASAGYPQYGHGDDYPFTTYSSTIQEGVQRGYADALRSYGEGAKLSAEAAVTFDQAQRQSLKTRKAAIETYYDVRRRAGELRAAERGPRPDAESLARLARQGRPKPLSPSEFDRFTGRLAWPALLRSEAFGPQRAEIEWLLGAQVSTRRLSAKEYLTVRDATDAMRAELKQRIHQLPPQDYIQAKRFLDRIAHHAAQPAGPLAAYAMRR